MLGLAGSAHCIGMCGPLALAVPSPRDGWWPRLASTLVLNSGRSGTYALLGAAFGSFGLGLRLVGMQQAVSVMAGAVLLLSILLPGSIERFVPTGPIALAIGRLRSRLAVGLKRTTPEALFLTGMLNGLLPCGLVYAAAIGSTAMGSSLGGAWFMVLFAVGTAPALIALRMSGALWGPRARATLRRASPVLVSIVAVLMILRGLELGIPMVSPAPIEEPMAITSCH